MLSYETTVFFLKFVTSISKVFWKAHLCISVIVQTGLVTPFLGLENKTTMQNTWTFHFMWPSPSDFWSWLNHCYRASGCTQHLWQSLTHLQENFPHDLQLAEEVDIWMVGQVQGRGWKVKGHGCASLQQGHHSVQPEWGKPLKERWEILWGLHKLEGKGGKQRWISWL